MPPKKRPLGGSDPDSTVGRLLLQLKLQAGVLKREGSSRASREIGKLSNALEEWLDTAESGPTALQRALAQASHIWDASLTRSSCCEL
jgi:hypothetical protein